MTIEEMVEIADGYLNISRSEEGETFLNRSVVYASLARSWLDRIEVEISLEARQNSKVNIVGSIGEKPTYPGGSEPENKLL